MIKMNVISATATAQQYAVEVSEKLCKPVCLTNGVLPNGVVNFSVGQTKLSDGIAYVEIVANGTITYTPVGCGCNSKVKQFSESVWVGFVTDTIPSVTLTATTPIQQASDVKCCDKAYGWSIVSALTIATT